MSNRHRKHLAALTAIGKRRVGSLDTHIDVLADEFQVSVAQQCARQQPRLAKNLKAVADAEHQPTARGELLDRAHHRAEARNRAGAQIIAVRKTARQYYRVAIIECTLPVPDKI